MAVPVAPPWHEVRAASAGCRLCQRRFSAKFLPTLATILKDHVKLSVECIDRMYLNVYVLTLQTVVGMLGYLRVHRAGDLPRLPTLRMSLSGFVSAPTPALILSSANQQRQSNIATRNIAHLSPRPATG